MASNSPHRESGPPNNILKEEVHHCSTAIERTEGVRAEVDAAIQQSVGNCIQETDLGIGERTVVR